MFTYLLSKESGAIATLVGDYFCKMLHLRLDDLQGSDYASIGYPNSLSVLASVTTSVGLPNRRNSGTILPCRIFRSLTVTLW